MGLPKVEKKVLKKITALKKVLKKGDALFKVQGVPKKLSDSDFLVIAASAA